MTKSQLAQQVVTIFVEGVGLADIAFQAMHGQVHLGQSDGGGGLFLAEEGDLVGRRSGAMLAR